MSTDEPDTIAERVVGELADQHGQPLQDALRVDAQLYQHMVTVTQFARSYEAAMRLAGMSWARTEQVLRTAVADQLPSERSIFEAEQRQTFRQAAVDELANRRPRHRA